MVDKIKVGALKDNSSFSGLWFADDCFEGIPKSLRIKQTDWKARGEYDQDKKAYIEHTLSSIKFSAYNQDIIGQVEKLGNDVLKSVMATQSLLDFKVRVPKKDDPAFADLLKWVEDLDKERQDDANQGKEMIFEKCEVHVVPIYASGTYGAFKGLSLELFNPTKVKISFVDPLQV